MSIQECMEQAEKAWSGATLNIDAFAKAYVTALAENEHAARYFFTTTYPLFSEREWRKLELVGRGSLLPQFFFKSDAFVGKLLSRKDSKERQEELVRAAESEDERPETRIAKCKRLVAAVNRSRTGKPRRGAREILNDIVDAIRELESLRDDEWEFEETHGDRAFWDAKVGREHDKLVGKILKARRRVRDLAREATGNNELEV